MSDQGPQADGQAKIIGNYRGTTIAKINPSGTQIIFTSYVDVSEVPNFNPSWLQQVYASPSFTVIYEPPPGFQPDLPRRGAPKKVKKVEGE